MGREAKENAKKRDDEAKAPMKAAEVVAKSGAKNLDAKKMLADMQRQRLVRRVWQAIRTSAPGDITVLASPHSDGLNVTAAIHEQRSTGLPGVPTDIINCLT